MPDFGADDKAIKTRLAIFQTKPLPTKNPRASEWLRINCMDIFHYCAHELRNVPIFQQGKNASKYTMGAIYNDFDCDTSMLPECITPSQEAALVGDALECIPRKIVERAIIDGNEFDRKMHESLAFETDLQDCVSACDTSYMEKVYKVATVEWRSGMIVFEDDTDSIYEKRVRCDWEGPDSVFDAWMLSNNYSRSWFDMDKFLQLYPDWPSIRKQLEEEYRHEKDPKYWEDLEKSYSVALPSSFVTRYFENKEAPELHDKVNGMSRQEAEEAEEIVAESGSLDGDVARTEYADEGGECNDLHPDLYENGSNVNDRTQHENSDEVNDNINIIEVYDDEIDFQNLN